jgi:hypothetical protein
MHSLSLSAMISTLIFKADKQITTGLEPVAPTTVVLTPKLYNIVTIMREQYSPLRLVSFQCIRFSRLIHNPFCFLI